MIYSFPNILPISNLYSNSIYLDSPSLFSLKKVDIYPALRPDSVQYSPINNQSSSCIYVFRRAWIDTGEVKKGFVKSMDFIIDLRS